MRKEPPFYDLQRFSHDKKLMTAERAAKRAGKEVDEAIQYATEMIVLYDGHPDSKQETEGPMRKAQEALHSLIILRSIVFKRLVELCELEELEKKENTANDS